MIRPALFTLALLGMAYTAWVHNTLAGVFSGATAVFLWLYLREREIVQTVLYINAQIAQGVHTGTTNYNLGDGDDE